jgi:hypothetical protein
MVGVFVARKAAPVVPVPQDDLSTTLERVALAAVRPHPRNYQGHPEAEIQHLMQSLLTHGVYKNVVIARDGTLLAGHGVVEAARRLGYTHLPMKRKDYDPDEPRAMHLLVADNEIARTVLRNEDLLMATLQDLSRDDPMALLGTGFDAAMLEALIQEQGVGVGTADAGRDVEPQIDRAEELREAWGVEVGQLWTCGEHRIICGDCTDKAVVEGLLGSATMDALVTDPPYGVGVDATMHSKGGQQYGHAAAPKNYYAATNWDTKAPDAFHLQYLLGLAPLVIIWGGHYFPLPPARCYLVWDKCNGLNEFADCELAWTNLDKPVRLIRHLWNGMLRANHEERGPHPTQKPLAVIEWCLQQFPVEPLRILDIYLGSGTTLIACENLGRTCYGCELDPGYVAVTLQRYQDLTGAQPQRLA